MTLWPVLLAGTLVGVGIVVLVAGLVPSAPNLHAALIRLDPHDAPSPSTIPADGSRLSSIARRRVLPQLVESLGLRRYAANLRMVDQTPEHLAARKVGYALLGLAFPTVLAGAAAVVGVRPP
ncbi:MAG TPA: hypothetical protein VGK17_07160, partial [Propionicimonas sp.]